MPAKYKINKKEEELLQEIKRLKSELKRKKKYGLIWEEKKEDVVEQCKEKLPVLKDVSSNAIFTDENKPINILIEGDNYHALSVLNYTHKGKIDLIYIDPPYNTGENDFKYNDKFVDKDDSFRHSKWLSFMSSRLKIAKNLLKETGVIIIHIDENEFDSLEVLLESDVFFEKNNLGTIIWNKKNPKGDAKGVSNMHEYIFCFAKNKENFLKLRNPVVRIKPNALEILKKAKSLYSKNGKSLIPDEIVKVIKPFNYSKAVLKDFEVKYTLELINKEFQAWLAVQDFSEGEKAYKFIDDNGDVYRGVSMAWPNKEKAPKDYFIPLKHPITNKKCPVPERGWRNPPLTMETLYKRGLILFGKDEKKQPERKYLLKDNLNENTPSIYNYGSSDDEFFKEIEINFPYAKPVEVAKYLISCIHPSPTIILDFFAGSGTTAHAILELNKEDNGDRKFILCTNNENNICSEVCYPRISKVIKGYKNKNRDFIDGLGGNLKYYQTDFVNAKPTDKNKKILTEKATDMLCLKEGTFEEIKTKNKLFKVFKNKNKYTGIIYDYLEINNFKKFIKDIRGKFSVYVFSLGDDTFDEEFREMENKIKLSPIPEAILRVYRRIFK